ncbi:MAG: hypothetical protein EXS16_06355 [Gemmataceae bacterium]|nr:hypothetical protein [Gemmataceae bacterium]
MDEKLAVTPGRVKVRVESITEPDAELAERFATLAETWRRETGHMSKMGRAAEHPAYREIIAMGEQAVPLMLADLEKEPDHWFIALREITGASPVPEESRGKIKEMAAAWVAWGRANGYRW